MAEQGRDGLGTSGRVYAILRVLVQEVRPFWFPQRVPLHFIARSGLEQPMSPAFSSRRDIRQDPRHPIVQHHIVRTMLVPLEERYSLDSRAVGVCL